MPTNVTISDVIIISFEIIFAKSSSVFSTMTELDRKCSTIGMISFWKDNANVDKSIYRENIFFSFSKDNEIVLLILIDYIILGHVQYDFQHYDVVWNNQDNIQVLHFLLNLWKNWFENERDLDEYTITSPFFITFSWIFDFTWINIMHNFYDINITL